MNRLDLGAALTKISLWKQTQFSKIVYLDADILALRAPDELFDVDADLAAVPDVGWPDCFNSVSYHDYVMSEQVLTGFRECWF